MGRPLKKDVKGNLVTGDYTTSAAGIRVSAYFGGSLRDDCFIVKQKGGRSYLVQDKSDSTTFVCKLISGTPDANGEMRLVGYTAPTEAEASLVELSKLQKRTATDFSGNRYSWYLENDSSADFIVLTPA
jgi:hypothetical protein